MKWFNRKKDIITWNMNQEALIFTIKALLFLDKKKFIRHTIGSKLTLTIKKDTDMKKVRKEILNWLSQRKV